MKKTTIEFGFVQSYRHKASQSTHQNRALAIALPVMGNQTEKHFSFTQMGT